MWGGVRDKYPWVLVTRLCDSRMCDTVTSYYVVFRITVHVTVYKVYLVLDIMYVLLMVSWNIFYNCGGA